MIQKLIQTIKEQSKNQMWFYISWITIVTSGACAVYYSYVMDITILKIILTINWPWLCICMIVLNATNPGIIPRRDQYFNDHQHEKFKLGDIHLFGSSVTTNYKRNYLQRTFCTTCKFNRLLRTHHCRKCDDCVQRFDHHCDWVGRDIGSYNRKIFFVFVFTTMYTDIIAAITTFLGIYFNYTHERSMYTPFLYYSFIMFSVVAYHITKLFLFHLKAMLHNYTTSEYIKNKKYDLDNPYDEGYKINFMKFFFTSNMSCNNLFSN